LRTERQLMAVVADRLSIRWHLGYDLHESEACRSGKVTVPGGLQQTGRGHHVVISGVRRRTRDDRKRVDRRLRGMRSPLRIWTYGFD
jgi:hypothetical protein